MTTWLWGISDAHKKNEFYREQWDRDRNRCFRDVPSLNQQTCEGYCSSHFIAEEEAGAQKENLVSQCQSSSARGWVQMPPQLYLPSAHAPQSTPASTPAATLPTQRSLMGKHLASSFPVLPEDASCFWSKWSLNSWGIVSSRIIFAFRELLDFCQWSRFSQHTREPEFLAACQ